MSSAHGYFSANSPPVRIVNDVLASLGNRFLFSRGLAGDFLNHGESVQRLQAEVKSVVRWGDGESLILQGGDIYFQPFSLELRTRLLEIIKNYTEDGGYYLAVPTQYLTSSSTRLRSTRRGTSNDFAIWRVSRFVYWKYFPRNKTYLDAFLFKGASEEQLKEVIKILAQFSTFVVVSSEADNVATFFGKNLKDSFCTTIAIPAKNAFESYRDILKAVQKKLDECSGANQKEILVLLSAGPCAKVLAYDLTCRGYTAFDVGKLFRCWT